MKKIKLKDIIFLIESIIFTVYVTIYNVSMIPTVCEVSIDRFGVNIGSLITIVVGCILISLIVVCVICITKVIQCIFFYK